LRESLDELHVTLGRLDRDDISIETLNGGEDVAEVRVAEVGMSLQLVSNASSSELERVNGPF
jgi:hypothetical protein